VTRLVIGRFTVGVGRSKPITVVAIGFCEPLRQFARAAIRQRNRRSTAALVDEMNGASRVSSGILRSTRPLLHSSSSEKKTVSRRVIVDLWTTNRRDALLAKSLTKNS
jgi:hypothetical protein